MILVTGATGKVGQEVVREVEVLVDLQRFNIAGGGSAVTPDVERVLGRNPISFDQFTRNHAQAWR